MCTDRKICACTVRIVAVVLLFVGSAQAGLTDFSDLDPGLPLNQQWAMPTNYSTGLPPGIIATWTGWMAKNAAGPDDHTPTNDDHMQAFGAGGAASITFSEPIIVEEIWMHKTSWGHTGDWPVIGLLGGVEQWSFTVTAADVWTSVTAGAGIPIDELSFPSQSQWNHIDDITTDLAEHDNARNPDPADGEIARPDVFDLNVYLLLDYTPGTYAVTNKAYFSDNEQDVINRNPANYLGEAPIWPAMSDTAFVVGYDDAAVAEFARTPLVRGKTYYWCVDTFDGTETHLGEVWSFTVMPIKAWNPSPPDGAENIDHDPNVTVTWSQGDVATEGYTISYGVYYGTDEAAVAAATTPNMTVTTESAEIGPLDYDTPYFWRIDTLSKKNAPPFNTIVTEGDVWEFTTIFYFPITDPNLKGWWKLDGDTFDWSGHGNHGTINGDPVWSAGHVGTGSLDFDGTDFVEAPHDESLTVDSEVTVMAWINAQRHNSAGGDWQGILAKSNNPRSYSFYTYTEGTLHFSTTSGGGYVGSNSTSTVPLNEWVHVCAMVAGGSHRYYINGAFAGEAASGIVLPGAADTGTVRIGMTNEGNNGFLGMIDDARIYNEALSEREIQVIAGLLSATNPDPANGASDVSRTPTLTWSQGPFAAAANGNVLYYGTDENAVADRTATSVTLTTPSFALPLTLDLGQSFYWAVDTVNGVETWPGDLWSFSVVGWKSVDDMESYTPWTSPGNNIFEAWRDGEGNCSPGNGNDTGSVLTENLDAAFVLGGIKSMKFDFDNDGMVYSPCTMNIGPRAHKYSRIEAQVATLASGIGTDWTVEGVKALQINFMGQLGNSATDPLWVQLQDSSKTYGTKVFYGDFEGEDLADMNDPSWHEWNIDLADFNIDLTNVVSIVIGIGNEGSATAGGSGTIYVDEIRLYTPRCVPNRAKSSADFDSSCDVDYLDAEILFDNWLLADVPEVADSGWMTTDIGDVNVLTGSYTDLGGGEFTMTGAGADIWGTADGGFYRYKSFSGDGKLTVRVTNIGGPSTNDWRKAGVMIRETLDAGSKHAFMAASPVGGGGKSLQRRTTADGISDSTHGIAPVVTTPICLRIARQGDTFRGFYNIGGGWVQHGDPVTIEMAENVHIGFAITSHDYGNSTTVTFDNVCSGDFIEPDLVEDGVINFEDYADLLNQWVDEVLWPE